MFPIMLSLMLDELSGHVQDSERDDCVLLPGDLCPVSDVATLGL